MELTDVAASGEVQVLTFDLGGETFALEAMVVREVLDLLPETPVPGSGGFAPSLINFRGRVIPVIELGLAFDLEIRPATRATRYVVIECDVGGETTLLGLRADRVHEVTSIDLSETEQLPGVAARWSSDFVKFLAQRGDDIVVMPNLNHIFAVKQTEQAAGVRHLRN